jgi:serine/threonine-protein kinase
MPLSPGAIISRYKILSLLGAGGMGEVYLAQDTRLNRKVAIKFLSEELSHDQTHLQRFLQEAQAASAFNHPNIITIHEIGQFEDSQFIATEYIAGETLRQRLSRELGLSEVVNVAIQVASALSVAHESGIVHRDIKPENIMLRQDGLVKVLDFGLAKLTEEPAIDSEAATRALIQTTPGAVMGTIAYMSPEQARGKTVDARADIWSLGVVLYEMLVGKQPFAGETMSDTMAAILKTEVVSPAHLNSEVPCELERIILKSLQKNRDERYQTAKDLLIDFKSLQKRLEFAAELEGASAISKRSEAKAQSLNIEPENSIAVLPFANISADSENEYFCDGLAEELLNALAKIEDLKVAARTSAFSFKDKNTNVSEIGNALKVKTVLEGSVRKSGNRIRITVQLVNAADGYHLWSERYDREMKDIFDVQDEITLAVVDSLKVKLLGTEKLAVLKRYTNNPEAYQLFLKGRYHWYKQTPENVRKSRDYFQQAINLDPTYAPGYAGLSEFYGISAALGMMPPVEGWQKAEAAMLKAQELDDTLPEVHNGLAAIRMFYYRDWDGAERELKRTIELNPNFAEVHHLYAYSMIAIGRLEDAIAEMKRALELDPLSPTYQRYLGKCFYYARKYDEAIREYHQALELDANNAWVYEEIGNAYEQKGMGDEAVAAWRQAMMLTGDNELVEILNTAYAGGGFIKALLAVAEQRLERLNDRSKSGEYVPAIEFARLYLRLGDKERAFEWLKKASEERNSFSLYISVDPFYDSLRADPRFHDLLRRAISMP